MKRYEFAALGIDPTKKERYEAEIQDMGRRGFRLAAAIPILFEGETKGAALYFEKEHIG